MKGYHVTPLPEYTSDDDTTFNNKRDTDVNGTVQILGNVSSSNGRREASKEVIQGNPCTDTNGLNYVPPILLVYHYL